MKIYFIQWKYLFLSNENNFYQILLYFATTVQPLPFSIPLKLLILRGEAKSSCFT